MSAAAAAAAGGFMPSGDIGDKAKSFVLITVTVLVVVIVIIAIKQGSEFFATFQGGIDKFLTGIGLKDSPEETKANEDLANLDPKANSIESPFNPTMYRTAPAGTPLKTQATLASLANQIYDAVGWFSDDPDAAFAAFKQCTNWAQVSQLSDKFNELFGKDVYDWLKIRFDTTKQKDTLVKIVNYAFALPKY